MSETVPGRAFLDAAYAIALVNEGDALHEIAVACGPLATVGYDPLVQRDRFVGRWP